MVVQICLIAALCLLRINSEKISLCEMDIVNLMKSLSVNENTETVDETNFLVFAADIGGICTEFVYGEFADKYMIVAAQYGKIGTLLKLSVDQVDGASEPVYSIKVLFGAENIEQQAAARYILETLNIQKPLLLFLSLQLYEPENVKAIAEALLAARTKGAPAVKPSCQQQSE